MDLSPPYFTVFLAELSGQRDDDALGAAEVGQAVRVLVLHFANSSATWARRRATTTSISSTANMTRRMPSVFTGASTGPNRIASGVWKCHILA